MEEKELSLAEKVYRKQKLTRGELYSFNDSYQYLRTGQAVRLQPKVKGKKAVKAAKRMRQLRRPPNKINDSKID